MKRKRVGDTGISSYIEAAAKGRPSAVKPEGQKAGITEGQNAGMPADRVKATFRLDPQSLVLLEAERVKRIAAGVRPSEADKSDLVNEAIRRAFGPVGKA